MEDKRNIKLSILALLVGHFKEKESLLPLRKIDIRETSS